MIAEDFKDYFKKALKLNKDLNFNALQKNFQSVSNSVDCLKYLKSRRLFDSGVLADNRFASLEEQQEAQKKFFKHISGWYFIPNNLEIGEKFFATKNSICIPVERDGNIYGFYSRSIFEKKFATFIDENWVGQKVWNFWNIDKSKDVYVCEGIFDAIALGIMLGTDNVCACLGASPPIELVSELERPIFALDNDKTGILTSIKMLSNFHNAKVLLVEGNKFKDFNDCLANKYHKFKILQGIRAKIELKSRIS